MLLLFRSSSRVTVPRYFNTFFFAFCSLVMGLNATGQDATKAPLDVADFDRSVRVQDDLFEHVNGCLLYTSPSPRD